MAKKVDLAFNINEDGMKLAVSAMKQKLSVIEKGGGEKAIAKQKEKGKLILITSQQLNELDELLTHVCMMDEAHILFFNSKQEIKDMTGKNILSSAVYHLFQNSKVI